MKDLFLHVWAGNVPVPYLVAVLVLAAVALVIVYTARKVRGRRFDFLDWLERNCSYNRGKRMIQKSDVLVDGDIYWATGNYPKRRLETMKATELKRRIQRGKEIPGLWFACIVVDNEYWGKSTHWLLGRGCQHYRWFLDIFWEAGEMNPDWCAEISDCNGQKGQFAIKGASKEEFLLELLNILIFFPSVAILRVNDERRIGIDVCTRVSDATQSKVLQSHRRWLENNPPKALWQIGRFEDYMKGRR